MEETHNGLKICGDEKYNEFLIEIKRPENCTSLTKTRVNNLMWD